VMAQL